MEIKYYKNENNIVFKLFRRSRYKSKNYKLFQYRFDMFTNSWKWHNKYYFRVMIDGNVWVK